MHKSLYELFSGIATVLKNNSDDNSPINPNNFLSLLFNYKDGKDYRVKSLIDRSIEYCSDVDLSGITRISNFSFCHCHKLALTSLPDSITSIGINAFSYCEKLALTSLPDGITEIGMQAFSDCTNLTTLTFKGTPASIGIEAFVNCSNLKTINVPWAEGEVDGAPWGATKATINYNYVE